MRRGRVHARVRRQTRQDRDDTLEPGRLARSRVLWSGAYPTPAGCPAACTSRRRHPTPPGTRWPWTGTRRGHVDVVVHRALNRHNRHIHDLAGRGAAGRGDRHCDRLTEEVRRGDEDLVVGVRADRGLVRARGAERDGRGGRVARFEEEPAISMYSSPSIISCSIMRVARAEMSSYPWP